MTEQHDNRQARSELGGSWKPLRATVRLSGEELDSVPVQPQQGAQNGLQVVEGRSPLDYSTVPYDRLSIVGPEYESNHPYFRDGTQAFLDYLLWEGTVWIGFINVHDDYTGQGYARTLLQALYDKFPNQRIKWGKIMDDAIAYLKDDFWQRYPERTTHKLADYQGWTNWDTWNTKLMMDNDYDLYQQQSEMAEQGWTPEQIRDWAIEHVIGPHNAQAIEDAKEWNTIPEEERIDYHFEELKNKSQDAADIVDALGFGPDTGDSEPQLIDPELVNWHEIHGNIMNDLEENENYGAEQQRLQQSGLSPDWMTPGHEDSTQHMREAMYRYHGALPDEEMKPDWDGGYTGNDPRSAYRRTVNIPFDELTQHPRFDLTDHISLDTRNELWSMKNQREIQKVWEEMAKDPKYADLDPLSLHEISERVWYNKPVEERDHIRQHNHTDPEVQKVISQDPQWQQTVQNGHEKRLTDYTWETIGDIEAGRAQPRQIQEMQQALAQRGFTPEQIAEMMQQKRRWRPEINEWENLNQNQDVARVDPALDQPGTLTMPKDWTSKTADLKDFHNDSAKLLEEYAALARDIAKTLPEEEWPQWVKNQILRQIEIVPDFIDPDQPGDFTLPDDWTNEWTSATIRSDYEEQQDKQAKEAQDPFQHSKEAAEGSLGEEGQVEYNWPDWETVDQISRDLVEPHLGYQGGSAGADAIMGAVGNTAMAHRFGAHADIFDTAAHLIAKIQQQQKVVEGNKRTATGVGLHFLEDHGYDTSPIGNEPAWSQFVDAVWLLSDKAQGEQAVVQLAQILRTNCPPHGQRLAGDWLQKSKDRWTGPASVTLNEGVEIPGETGARTLENPKGNPPKVDHQWVYLNGQVAFGGHNWDLAHQLATQLKLPEDQVKLISNSIARNHLPANIDIAYGEMRDDGYPQIWNSTLDRNAVWDAVVQQKQKTANMTIGPAKDEWWKEGCPSCKHPELDVHFHGGLSCPKCSDEFDYLSDGSLVSSLPPTPEGVLWPDTIPWGEEEQDYYRKAALAKLGVVLDPMIGETAMAILGSDGGFSLNLDGTPVAPGYYTSIEGHERIVPLESINAETIDNYVSDHLDILLPSDNFLGAWVSDGDVYLDVSRSFPTEDEMVEFARKNKQVAGWDGFNNVEIPVSLV